MKIRSAVLAGPRRVEIIEEDAPVLCAGEVMVEVVASGVCTSELPVYRGETEGVAGVSFRYAKYPCALGHEVSGVVVDVGGGVESLKRGDRVTGVAYRGSGFATHVIEGEGLFVKAPDSVPLEQVLGEPLMAATNIVRMAEPEFGDFVVIVGDGFMSLLTIAALSGYPLKELVVVGHHDSRLALAEKIGATRIINSNTQDPYWEVRRMVDGTAHDPGETLWRAGVDIAFDLAGNMAALKLCASLCKPKQRAKLMMPSFYGPEPFAIGHYLMNRAPSLIACHPAHSRDVIDDLRRAIRALGNGTFDLAPLITHVFSLEETGVAMEASISRENGYIKGIVVPDLSRLESKGRYKRTTGSDLG